MIDKEKLDEAFDSIRAQLKNDGGDAEITKIDNDEGIIYVKLQGACVGCPMASVTLSQGIEQVLKEYVPGVNKVLPDLD